MFVVTQKRPYEYDLILQSDINSDADIAWFNFAVEFVEEGYYSFNIVNLVICAL